MKIKRNLLILCITTLIFYFTGCESESESITINVENSENISGTMFGDNAMIEIGSGLWYDSSTRIVYWWNNSLMYGGQSSTTPSPYYAPNGFPYRYNPETNTFEEIEVDKNE